MILALKPLQIIFSRWLEEIDRKQAELVAAQITLEKLRQQDQSLRTETEMLKVNTRCVSGHMSFLLNVRTSAELCPLKINLAFVTICRWRVSSTRRW